MGNYDRLKEVIKLLPNKARVTLDWSDPSISEGLRKMLGGCGLEPEKTELSSVYDDMPRENILGIIKVMETQQFNPPYVFKCAEYRVENTGRDESGGAHVVVTPREIKIYYVNHHCNKMPETLKDLLTKFSARGILEAKISLEF